MFSFKEQTQISQSLAETKRVKKDKKRAEKGLPSVIPLRQRVFQTVIIGLIKATDLGVQALEKRRTGTSTSTLAEPIVERIPSYVPSREILPVIMGRDVCEGGVELLIFDSEMRTRIKDVIRSDEKNRLDLTGNVLRAVDQDGNRIPFSPSEAIGVHDFLHHAFEKDRDVNGK